VATQLCLLNKMFFRDFFPGKIIPVENMLIALSLLSAQNAEYIRMGYMNMEFFHPEIVKTHLCTEEHLFKSHK
jgi:hypothetical protein